MLVKIRGYIDQAFEGAPYTKKVYELKQELFANLSEKYNDQIASGKSEQEAYSSAISSIGDIDELVGSVADGEFYDQEYGYISPKQRKKSAVLVAGAIMLYILSPISVIALSVMGDSILGVILLLTLVALATGMLIYNDMTKPKFVKLDEINPAEYRDTRGMNFNQAYAYKTFKSAFWSIVVAVYLLVSFLMGWWAFSWIIFIIAGAIENIVRGLIELRRHKHE